MLLALASCNPYGWRETLCGYEIEAEEIARFEHEVTGFEPNQTDRTLQGQFQKIVAEAAGEYVDATVQVLRSNRKEVSVFVLAPPDADLMERVSCALMSGQYDGLKDRQLQLFYYDSTVDFDHLLIAVRNAKQPT